MAAHWEQIDEWARQGGISATSSVALLELRARVEALEQAIEPVPTPNPTPPPTAPPLSLTELIAAATAAVTPEGGYELGAGAMDGSQWANDEWWSPEFGCDSLEQTLDAIRSRLVAAITDWHRSAIAAEQPTPDPTPPPVRGVTVDELRYILFEMRFEGNYMHCARKLLDHPRLGPLLRGEGQAKRVELAERQGWKEAAIAWECCASIHREYAKGRDPLFKTRQSDFGRAADAARDELARQQGEA